MARPGESVVRHGPMAAKTSTTKKTPSKRPSRAPAALETTTTTTTTTAAGPSRDEIAKRAFELFLARGRQHGHAEADWLNAERELRERYSVS